MTNLYEYKHPVINTELASSSIDKEPKKFETLQDWEDVINDYEFQARCPIILKNSHRNKHFTFACHLKGCPFKILLSYSNGDNPNVNHTSFYEHGHGITGTHQNNNNNGNVVDTAIAAAAAAAASSSSNHDDNDTLIDVKEDQQNKDEKIDNDVETETERKYTESDATDQNVTDAIAAAVAAVQNPATKKEDETNNDSKNFKKDSNDLGVKIDHPLTNDLDKKNNINSTISKKSIDDNETFNVDDIILDAHGSNANQNSAVKGPFIVTKIEPYHNHSLEENLTLDKFVLTKIPRILQFDLNFDNTLEEIYQKSNRSLSKFKVSQFVEHSGLLTIIKKRYHLIDEDLNKKFKSLISRRVTTYKARFVLKKKKTGEYRDLNPDSYIGNTNKTSGNDLETETPVNQNTDEIDKKDTNNKTTIKDESIKTEKNNESSESKDNKPHTKKDGTKKKNKSDSHKNAQKNKDTNDNNILMSENLDDAIKNISDGKDELNAEDDKNNDINRNNEDNGLSDEKAVRAAAQAAISGESINNLKRTFGSVIGNVDDMDEVVVDEDDLEGYGSNKRNKNEQSSKGPSIEDNPLAGLDDMHDDKLPHDVAEQLRLLSSHFKDVETASLQNNSVDNENDQDEDQDRNNDQDEDDEDRLNERDDDDYDEKSKNEDISDDNIQPELRG
ncbi:Abf1p [Maudiozyma exigua]|uniref:Abf1p n=1 Tax=Maudiozyma exigua TaxID=34358 RepID=A0A9P7BBJ0_MAUEX|nr:Abf1p [Kazachstania exigua]